MPSLNLTPAIACVERIMVPVVWRLRRIPYHVHPRTGMPCDKGHGLAFVTPDYFRAIRPSDDHSCMSDGRSS
jgi:hypothetical protein